MADDFLTAADKAEILSDITSLLNDSDIRQAATYIQKSGGQTYDANMNLITSETEHSIYGVEADDEETVGHEDTIDILFLVESNQLDITPTNEDTIQIGTIEYEIKKIETPPLGGMWIFYLKKQW